MQFNITHISTEGVTMVSQAFDLNEGAVGIYFVIGTISDVFTNEQIVNGEGGLCSE